ncbi:MAG TPA: energy transducer TonB [Azospira sp.]|nr:energy transducer TonB [Azospira sp.]
MWFPRLTATLLCSLALHAAAVLLMPPPAAPVRAAAPLAARLRLPPPMTPAQEEAPAPEAKAEPPRPKMEPKPPPRPEKPARAKPAPARFQEPPASFNGYPVLAGTAARSAFSQLARQPLYPAEAIARGLQGEVLLLLFLDGNGNVQAARVERSSGQPILDQAAVSAARQLKALPEGAPREAILPVRFRLD